MKRAPVFVQVICCIAIAASALAQQQQFANLGDIKLQNGEILYDCRIGYRTYGTLNADKSNAVLFPTWGYGTTDDLEDFMRQRTMPFRRYVSMFGRPYGNLLRKLLARHDSWITGKPEIDRTREELPTRREGIT